jgi:hypothetical protein
MANRHETEHKSFEAPDERREFPNGHAEILEIGGGEVGEEPAIVVDWYGASNYAKTG